jgi:hypothetical protein
LVWFFSKSAIISGTTIVIWFIVASPCTNAITL